MTDRTPQTEDKYVVRFPDGMRDRLKELAKANNRSLNAQIVHMLEWAMEEVELAAGTYGKPDPTASEQTDAVRFLRRELRRNQEILEKILHDVEAGAISPSKL